MKLILLSILLGLIILLFIPVFNGGSQFYVLEVSSIFPFEINGVSYPPGNYYLMYRGIANITFFNLYYQSNTSRLHLIGINFNGTFLNSSSEIIGILKIYSKNNFTSVIVNTTELFYTHISSLYDKEFYVIVNARHGSPISSGWYASGELLTIPLGDTYQNGSIRYIISHVLVNGTQKTSFNVNSPLIVNVTYLVEYLVNFSKPTYAYMNGSLEIMSSQWLPNDTQLAIPKYINLTRDTRIFTTGNLTGVVYINKPIIINDTQIFQYYVNVKDPVIAKINGNYTNFTSNWYNAGTQIFIPPYFPLINDYRIAIYGNLTGMFTIESPLIINDRENIQYYLQFPFPLQISLSNGTLYYGTNIWINNGTYAIIYSQIRYINNVTRAIVIQQVFNSPNFGKLNYILQYFVTSNLPLPVSINGTNTTLTNGWFNQSTEFYVYPVYYVNSTERIVILYINYRNITLLSPLYFNVYYIKEYLVNIEGYYSHLVILDEKLWEPYGSIVQIPLQYEYEGIYFESNSTTNQYYIFGPSNITIYYKPIDITTSVYTPVIAGLPIEAFVITIIIIIVLALVLLIFNRSRVNK